MWRAFILVFMILTTSIGGMLFWQWKAYSKQYIPINENDEKIVQEITVQTSKEELQITQKLTGLTTGKEYRMTIPESLLRWSCIKAKGEGCETKDEHAFLSENNEIMFEYNISVSNEKKSFLLNDWTTVLPEVEIKSTSIEIIDSVRRKGTWVTGMPLKGHKEMDLIDYYYFTGIGDTPSIYWQLSPLEIKQSHNGIVYYTNQLGSSADYSFNEIKELTNFPSVSVVLSDENAEITGKRIILTHGIDEEMLKRKLINYFYEEKFKGIPSNEQWILDVFTSATANLPAKTEKGKAILLEMNKKLSEEELTLFFKQLNSGPQKLTTQTLDNFMGKLKGYNTRFFTLNKDKSAPFVPLYFSDPRKVTIMGKEKKDIKVMIEEGNMLYPFIDTMRELGFEVKSLADQEMILLTKGSNSYRFYLNRNIFIYNEEDYGLLESPLTNLNGKIYMNKQWIQTIFNISINEGTQEIRLSL
ncbi:hypothetical protein BGM26_01675 [Bacillus sp. FJAT-29790]|uniref:stalk domain-containing protein n=1 Tax=Bacillus sp. FJAT-29790 TaxID=1895002 RepID=UPI001C21E548|nr:stalk domain-containing protein [Bacillus sp. FJAT-29790]MBU8877697.1 hypothetical protein [Bacillus sp. FJAT-29790]